MLVDEMRSYLDRGYTVVKMKIGGVPLAEDLARIEAVLAILPAGCKLAVDANGRFETKTAIAYARALSAYDLFWYEEPGDPLDYALQAELAQHYPKPMATGENLFSTADAQNLIRYGGMRKEIDWLQFDCALSYGLVEYLRTLAMLARHGWSPSRCIPHGGHQMSLAIAAGLGLGGNESYPDLFQPPAASPTVSASKVAMSPYRRCRASALRGKAISTRSWRLSAPKRRASARGNAWRGLGILWPYLNCGPITAPFESEVI